MKIKVSYTVEVNPKLVEFYIKDLQSDETVREFVKSHCEASGIGCLDETLSHFEKYMTDETI